MKANYRAAASAGLLLSACANVGQAATTVQVTVGPQAASSSFDTMFSTLTSVEQLVSISDGAVNTGEGSTMTINAILEDNSLVEIFRKSVSPSPPQMFQNVSLQSLTLNTFTPLSTPQNVKGLRFGFTGFPAGNLAFPALTVLTFSVVPEPAAAVMMMLGFVFLAFRHRRKLA
ncbi:MAG TPA: PEP-CTERM sorting domain-containing protein [Luteolibacter sp.]|nr:PEP-CTERM sorting domain-containing protein [Luteolibacter sp.]